jgi:two-component system NtrC family sensor kinase
MSPPPSNITNRQDLGQIEQVLAHMEQVEARFAALRDQLTHCHRLSTLGTLTSIIAHEYNNILTPVISYAQLALARPEDRDLLIKAVEKALAGAERAASLSASILGFAREDHDPAVDADLPAVARESIQCLGRDPAKDGISVHVDLPDVRVAIPPVQLQQVVVNLMLNAREAMKRGGELHITGRIGGDAVAMEVRDTGPGIDPAVMGRLFEPFVTTKHGPDHTGGKQGTGLGLCICRDMVRRVGGDITVASEPGRGATFTVTLPLAGADGRATAA